MKPSGRPPLLLIAHPSPDRYGSDRQLLETVAAMVEASWRVVVVLPAQGPLVALLADRGAEVEMLDFPVLRKSLLRPSGLVRLASSLPAATVRMAGVVRRTRPDVVLVNTLTVPWWLAAAKLAGVPSLCHVHEAEDDQPRLVGIALASPLLLAATVVTNSSAAAAVLHRTLPRLAARTTVVHNGIAGPPWPPTPPRQRAAAEPAEVVVVARLSPRKGIDVALEALALLRGRGCQVRLTLCGTPFPGYEWYEEQLRDRSRRADLAGAVSFAGYVDPTWDALAGADVVLVPSRSEPFGNTAVEALLAGRPLVASGVQGLLEVVDDGRTGLLVPPGDSAALARAVTAVLDDPPAAARLAAAGREDAERRFSVTRYRRDLCDAVVSLSGR